MNAAANGGTPKIMRTRKLSADMRARFEMLENDLQHDLVPAWVFGSDHDVYALERERLFPRAWTVIGHVSEIPNRGDHLLRYIGEDPFIFIRSQDDRIRLLFNACRHRGSQLCTVERGNSEKFQCPYHGWTYASSGELIGAPAQSNAIGGELGALLAAAGLGAYAGPPTGYVLTFSNGLVTFLSGNTGITAE